MISRNLTGTGFPPLAAQAIAGTVNDGLTATGTTQATALLISGDLNVFSTVASGAGCILPVGGENDTYSIINDGANALLIYPPLGGTISGGAVNASISIAVSDSIQLTYQSSLSIRVIGNSLTGPSGAGLVGYDFTSTYPDNTVGIELQNLRAHRHGVYSYYASYVKRWLLSLAAVRNLSSSASIACIGDSTTMGYNASGAGYTDGRIYSFPTAMRNLFNFAGVAAQSNSFFGDSNAGVDYATYDPRVTLGAGITHNGGTSLGGFFFSLPPASGALNFAPGNGDTFDRIDIYILNTVGGGTFDVDVGGATIANISTNATRGVVKNTVSCAAGSSQVNLTNASGTCLIVGVNVYSTLAPAVAILNMGWSGSTSGDWSRTTFPEDPANAISAVNPEATLINLGINDWVAGTAVATTKANLLSIINEVRPYSAVYLVVPIPSEESLIPLATQKLYRDAIIELGYEQSCPVIDLMERRESWASSNSFNLYSDSYHATTFGNIDVAQALAELLLNP